MNNMQAIEFKTLHHARFSDLDPYGHMNNESYLGYFMDHRFIGLRETLGFDLKEILKLPIFFVTTKVEIDYKRSITGDEPFFITSKIIDAQDKSCSVECVMKNIKESINAICMIQIVSVDRTTQKPIHWPAGLLERFYKAA